MSKAFTRETDTEDEEEDTHSSELAIPAGSKNYITPAGAERMRAELKRLLYEERPEMVKTVSWAASNGDRSENGDYIYGKRRLREIDRRIRFLTQRLEKTEIINPASQKADVVLFGATVVIGDEEGRKRTYRIVGIDETDVGQGLISWVSPLAKALLNSRVGESVLFLSPKGEEELEILEIRYESG